MNFYLRLSHYSNQLCNNVCFYVNVTQVLPEAGGTVGTETCSRIKLNVCEEETVCFCCCGYSYQYVRCSLLQSDGTLLCCLTKCRIANEKTRIWCRRLAADIATVWCRRLAADIATVWCRRLAADIAIIWCRRLAADIATIWCRRLAADVLIGTQTYG